MMMINARQFWCLGFGLTATARPTGLPRQG
jgi:hypothetical protein